MNNKTSVKYLGNGRISTKPEIEIIHMVEKFLSRKKLSHSSIVTQTIGKLSATLKTVAAFTLIVKLNQKETATISLPNGDQVSITLTEKRLLKTSSSPVKPNFNKHPELLYHAKQSVVDSILTTLGKHAVT